MKLQATLDERQIEVRIDSDGPHVVAVLDDRQYDLDVHEISVDQFLLLHEGKVFDCRVAGRTKSGSVDVFVGTERYAVTIIDPKRLRSALSASAHGHEAAHIVAPMPGKVVRISAEAGVTVQAGQGIVTVEAMKMQNEMKSPKDGTIVAVNVQVGATVNAGDVLAIIE